MMTDIINTIKSLLLKINLKETKYKELVKSWDSEFTFGFVEAKDSDYDLIRKYSGNTKMIPIQHSLKTRILFVTGSVILLVMMLISLAILFQWRTILIEKEVIQRTICC